MSHLSSWGLGGGFSPNREENRGREEKKAVLRLDQPTADSSKMEHTEKLLSVLENLPQLMESAKIEINKQKRSDTKTASGEIEQLKQQVASLTRDCDDLKKARQDDMASVKQLREEKAKQASTIESLRQLVGVHKQNIETLANEKQQLLEIENKLKEENRKLETDLSQTKTRLSKIMGDRLTDSNPDIADLSDINRPTKIGERFKELYDNQWTDAFEAISDGKDDERECIDALLALLKHIRDFCNKASEEQNRKILASVSDPFERSVSSSTHTDGPDTAKKQVKDFRKGVAHYGIDTLYQAYMKKVGPGYSVHRKLGRKLEAKEVKLFVNECVQLCWLMSVQDPPVVIEDDPRHGEEFDTNKYKAYTQSGPRLDYLVWPALLLHKGGSLLDKGVAQGYGHQIDNKTKRSRSKQSTDDVQPSNDYSGSRSVTTDLSTGSEASCDNNMVFGQQPPFQPPDDVARTKASFTSNYNTPMGSNYQGQHSPHSPSVNQQPSSGGYSQQTTTTNVMNPPAAQGRYYPIAPREAWGSDNSNHQSTPPVQQNMNWSYAAAAAGRQTPSTYEQTRSDIATFDNYARMYGTQAAINHFGEEMYRAWNNYFYYLLPSGQTNV